MLNTLFANLLLVAHNNTFIQKVTLYWRTGDYNIRRKSSHITWPCCSCHHHMQESYMTRSRYRTCRKKHASIVELESHNNSHRNELHNVS